MSWIADMAAAATEVTTALGPDVRIPVDDPRRLDWTYVPSKRHGVRFAEMTQVQRGLVHRLLAAGLSPEAYGKVCAIVALEEVLDLLEGGGRRRNSGNYWTAVYGEPGDDEWAWSFEGHHVSINIAIAAEAVRPTPLFLGANPHAFAIRPLGEEEDLARAALDAMPARQRHTAIIAGEAPADIITETRAAVGVWELEPLGVPAAEVPDEAWRPLELLLRGYLGRVRTPVALPGRDEVWFAWAGGAEPGTPHYYRLQAPELLIEYDNTQDGANHSHTVWRVPGADFASDVLLQHRNEHHRNEHQR